MPTNQPGGMLADPLCSMGTQAGGTERLPNPTDASKTITEPPTRAEECLGHEASSAGLQAPRRI
eukprot:9485863-Pyramimonas_sp.AAC.2